MFRKVKDFFADCFNSVDAEDICMGVCLTIAVVCLLFFLLIVGSLIYENPMVAVAIVGITLAITAFVVLVWFFMGLYVKLTRPPVQHYEDVWNLPPD